MWIKFYLTSPLDESVVKERILFFGNFNQAVFTKNKGMLKTINYKLPTSPCHFTAKKISLSQMSKLFRRFNIPMYSRKQMSMKNIPNTPSVHNIYINFHKTKKTDSENNLIFLGFSLYRQFSIKVVYFQILQFLAPKNCFKNIWKGKNNKSLSGI